MMKHFKKTVIELVILLLIILAVAWWAGAISIKEVDIIKSLNEEIEELKGRGAKKF